MTYPKCERVIDARGLEPPEPFVLTMDALESKINDLEAALRAKYPHLRRIYVEPGFDEEKLRKDRGLQY